MQTFEQVIPRDIPFVEPRDYITYLNEAYEQSGDKFKSLKFSLVDNETMKVSGTQEAIDNFILDNK